MLSAKARSIRFVQLKRIWFSLVHPSEAAAEVLSGSVKLMLTDKSTYEMIRPATNCGTPQRQLSRAGHNLLMTDTCSQAAGHRLATHPEY